MKAFFSSNKFFKSFGYALKGIRFTFKEEQNFRMHILLGAIVLVVAIILKVSKAEFALLIICIGFVLVAELLNTSVEKLCDFTAPQFDEKIKIIKDISAGAVLIASFVSAIIGTIIFLPKIIALL